MFGDRGNIANKRLAIVSTHPIQYYAPLFRRLTERGVLDVRVFYGSTGSTQGASHDHAFGRDVCWDIPLLDGYAHEFVPNRATDPGPHHFRGIDTPDLPARVRAYGPDAVLVIGWNYIGHLRALRALHGHVPILFRGDSTLLDERLDVRKLARRAWLRYVYSHVDLAFYVGQHNREYFRAHGISDDRLVWAPHTVDNDRFSDPRHDVEALEWRRSMGIPRDSFVFLFAGKLESKKAPELLLDSFIENLSNENHLVFVGSGVMEEDLHTRASGRSNIHFAGFCNQSVMPVAYRLGNTLVLPSRGPAETWGLAVNESFASARPAIVSDKVGCAPDLIKEGETGFVVPTDDALALATAMARIATDREGQMGRRARSLIDNWSIERHAEIVEDVLLCT